MPISIVVLLGSVIYSLFMYSLYSHHIMSNTRNGYVTSVLNLYYWGVLISVLFSIVRMVILLPVVYYITFRYAWDWEGSMSRPPIYSLVMIQMILLEFLINLALSKASSYSASKDYYSCDTYIYTGTVLNVMSIITTVLLSFLFIGGTIVEFYLMGYVQIASENSPWMSLSTLELNDLGRKDMVKLIVQNITLIVLVAILSAVTTMFTTSITKEMQGASDIYTTTAIVTPSILGFIVCNTLMIVTTCILLVNYGYLSVLFGFLLIMLIQKAFITIWRHPLKVVMGDSDNT
jgi:hypothetical protein